MRKKSLHKGLEAMKKVLYHPNLLYASKIMCIKLISQDHNNLLAKPFGINKIQQLVVRNYYLLTLRVNIEFYVKRYNIWFASKLVKHKISGDLQFFLILIYQQKDLSINFGTKLLISTNPKDETYDSILVIVNRLIKIVYYELVKVTFDASGFVKVIINLQVWYYDPPRSIFGN